VEVPITSFAPTRAFELLQRSTLKKGADSVFYIFFLLLAGCSLGHRELTPAPVYPAISPPPAPASAPVPSEMPFPFSIPISDSSKIEKQCCSFVNASLSVPLVGSVRFELWRRVPLDEINFSRDTISASAYVWYEVDAGDLAQCGWDDEEARAVIVGFDSKVKWAPDWSLDPSTKFRPIQPQNRCLLTRWNHDATDQLAHVAQNMIDRLATRLDDKMRSRAQQYRPKVEDAWKYLQQPVPLGDGQWMLLQPKSVTASPIEFKSYSTFPVPIPIFPTHYDLTSAFSIKTEPILVKSDQPPPVTYQPLPDLVVAPDPSGLHLHSDIGIGLQQITVLLNDPRTGLVGRTFAYGRRELSISRVRLYTSSSAVIVELDIRGRALPASPGNGKNIVTFVENLYRKLQYAYERRFYSLSGTIYLTTEPSYSAANGTIGLSDIQYDSSTWSAISSSDDRWIAATSLLGGISATSAFTLSTDLNTLKSRLSSVLNRQVGRFGTLSGGVDSLGVEQIFLEDDQIKARIAIDCHARLNVAW
jgi:hypothetical protein